MLGALIGDIIGSKYEFNNIKTKEFSLFDDDCYFTDDTVMTIAVEYHLLTKNDLIDSLKMFGKTFPGAGYGDRFYSWVLSNDRQPYNSCGNGSAMRVSGAGWIATSLKEAEQLAKEVSEVTHNHKEGIKGAKVVAGLIYLARTGSSKEKMRDYALKYYPTIATKDYDELIKNYYHGPETCQASVPEALYCFFISNSFEDCLRTTISIGGDCDTTAAISCAIAEAYYGIDISYYENIKKYFKEKNSQNLLTILNGFVKKCGLESYEERLNKK